VLAGEILSPCCNEQPSSNFCSLRYTLPDSSSAPNQKFLYTFHMLRILLLLSIAITVYAFVDCARTPQEEVRKLPKWAWLLLIVLFSPSPIVSIAWLVIGRERGRGNGGWKRPPRKIIPPDDNPDFLRNL
jgi:cytochrome bd-type quinol oxidase subunit 1